MAIITKLDKGGNINPKRNKETEGVYYLIDDFEERYVQIDTFGSSERKDLNKVSQSIRINKDIAKKLVDILIESFNL